MPHCLFKKAATCRMAACTEAQGVRCCSTCPYRKNCRSGCDIPAKAAAERKTPPDAQSEGEQMELEGLFDG